MEKKAKKGAHKALVAPKLEFHLGILEIAAIVLASVLVWWTSPYLAAALRDWSYAGAFVLALLSSVTLFLPAWPLQLAIVRMAMGLDPFVLALVAGVGSGIGELTGFFLGQGSRHILQGAGNQKPKGILEKIQFLQTGLLRKYQGPALFVLAAVPNPLFDFAGVYAGMAGMKWWEYLAWCTAGRVLRFLVLAYLGIWSARFFA